jgi:hypothetical protein
VYGLVPSTRASGSTNESAGGPCSRAHLRSLHLRSAASFDNGQDCCGWVCHVSAEISRNQWSVQLHVLRRTIMRTIRAHCSSPSMGGHRLRTGRDLPQAVRWLPALQVVLPAHGRWEAPYVAGRQGRHRLPNPDPARFEAHQAGSGQLGQVKRLWDRESPASGGDQSEEVGYRPGSQHRRPVPTDVGVVGGIPGRLEPVRPDERAHQRPAPYGGR